MCTLHKVISSTTLQELKDSNISITSSVLCSLMSRISTFVNDFLKHLNKENIKDDEQLSTFNFVVFSEMVFIGEVLKHKTKFHKYIHFNPLETFHLFM